MAFLIIIIINIIVDIVWIYVGKFLPHGANNTGAGILMFAGHDQDNNLYNDQDNYQDTDQYKGDVNDQANDQDNVQDNVEDNAHVSFSSLCWPQQWESKGKQMLLGGKSKTEA